MRKEPLSYMFGEGGFNSLQVTYLICALEWIAEAQPIGLEEKIGSFGMEILSKIAAQVD